MLATETGGSEPSPDSSVTDDARQEVIGVLAALGPHLLAASRAIDGPTPRAAFISLSAAARVLRAYLT